MVYIESWTEYQAQAEKLYEQHPDRTRYCVKYRAADGSLVLKVTDDYQCLKYKTRSSIMLNRFEAFNLSMISKMQNRRPQQPTLPGAPAPSKATGAPAPGTTLKASSGAQDVVMADTAAGQGAGGATSQGANPAGAAKKKKPKKKK